MFYWMKVPGPSSLMSSRQWSWTANWTPLPMTSGGNTTLTLIALIVRFRGSTQQADTVSMSRVVLVRWESIVYSYKTVDTTGVTQSQQIYVSHITWMSSVRQPFLSNCITFYEREINTLVTTFRARTRLGLKLCSSSKHCKIICSVPKHV